MSKQITGGLFCLAASILFSARYVAAAILVSTMHSWDKDIFSISLNYVGSGLLVASILCLITGVLYLISAEKGNKGKGTDIV